MRRGPPAMASACRCLHMPLPGCNSVRFALPMQPCVGKGCLAVQALPGMLSWPTLVLLMVALLAGKMGCAWELGAGSVGPSQLLDPHKPCKGGCCAGRDPGGEGAGGGGGRGRQF